MHPYLTAAHAVAHREELLREADHERRQLPRTSRRRAGSWRIRTGWYLVEVGLRLAVADQSSIPVLIPTSADSRR